MKKIIISMTLIMVTCISVSAKASNVVFIYSSELKEYVYNDHSHVFNNPSYLSSKQWMEELQIIPLVSVMDDCQCPNEYLPELINKAMKKAQEGAIIAIDKIEINLTDGWCGTCKWDREDCEDHVMEILLDKGYKVVSKENIEKYREDNPSFVGYYINVKVTDEKMRIQLIDVVSGDFVGNAVIY